MKKFAYRMESVLGIKQKLEEQEKLRFSTAAQRLREEEAIYEAIQQKKEGYEERMRQAVNARLDLQKIQEYGEAVEVLKAKLKWQAEAVRRAQRELEEARLRLQAASIERKTQETLREHAFEAYLAELRVEEQKELDETTGYQYMMEKREEA